MKKTLLYSMAALAGMTLAGCNGDYDDWASPQGYGPESAAAKYGVTFAAGPEAKTVMPDADGTISLVSINTTNAGIVGYTLKSLTVNGEPIDGTVDGNMITVNAAELSKMVEKQHFSRASVARSLKVVAAITANLGNGDAVTIDMEGKTEGSLTPAATPQFDAKGYYMLGAFGENGNGWDLSSPVWMTANGDGTYTATVNTTGTGDNYFKFYEGSHYANGNWDEVNLGQMGCAVNGDNARQNFLVCTSDPLYAGVETPVISGRGTFEVTLDMNNLTYTVVPAEAKYYIVGSVNDRGWNAEDCLKNMFYGLGGNVYCYTTRWNGAWDLKFWKGSDIGNWDATICTEKDGDGSVEGSLVTGNKGAFQSPAPGYYTLTVNMADNTYKWTAVEGTPVEYNSVSLIGDFNGWGGDTDLVQLPNAPHNWYVRATISTTGGLKFRANHDWATSWGTSGGGSIADTYYAPTGSANIPVEAGIYDFYLNDITGHFNIVAVE